MSKEVALLIPIVIIAACVVYLIKAKRSGNGKMIRKIILSAIYIFIGFFAYSLVVDRIDANSAKALNACPASIENISYGKAIESYCSDVTWSDFADENSHNTVIEMNGKANYKNKEHDIKIQFMSDEDVDNDGYFGDDAAIYVRFVGLDDTEETQEETEKDILFAMFSKYAAENGLTLDESQKDGILETKAYQQKNASAKDSSEDVSDAEDTQKDTTKSSNDSEEESGLEDVDFDPCYAGVTNSENEYAYLGFVDEKKALLVVYDSEEDEDVYMAGDITVDEETGTFTITDQETQATMTFSVEEQDDGSYLLDLGDDVLIYLEKITSKEFKKYMNALMQQVKMPSKQMQKLLKSAFEMMA